MFTGDADNISLTQVKAHALSKQISDILVGYHAMFYDLAKILSINDEDQKNQALIEFREKLGKSILWDQLLQSIRVCNELLIPIQKITGAYAGLPEDKILSGLSATIREARLTEQFLLIIQQKIRQMNACMLSILESKELQNDSKQSIAESKSLQQDLIVVNHILDVQCVKPFAKTINQQQSELSTRLFAAVVSASLNIMQQIDPDKDPQLTVVYVYFRQLTLLVIEDIALQPNIDTQAMAMSRWLNIAYACFKYGDFNSAGIVTRALRDEIFTQYYKKIAESLSKTDQEKLAELTNYFIAKPVELHLHIEARIEKNQFVIPDLIAMTGRITRSIESLSEGFNQVREGLKLLESPPDLKEEAIRIVLEPMKKLYDDKLKSDPLFKGKDFVDMVHDPELRQLFTSLYPMHLKYKQFFDKIASRFKGDSFEHVLADKELRKELLNLYAANELETTKPTFVLLRKISARIENDEVYSDNLTLRLSLYPKTAPEFMARRKALIELVSNGVTKFEDKRPTTAITHGFNLEPTHDLEKTTVAYTANPLQAETDTDLARREQETKSTEAIEAPLKVEHVTTADLYRSLSFFVRKRSSGVTVSNDKPQPTQQFGTQEVEERMPSFKPRGGGIQNGD